MMKTEHLLFSLLMIPTLLIIAAGAISMADVTLPALTPSAITAREPVFPAPAVWDEDPAMLPFKSTLVPPSVP
jgi:hypothetical protein